MDDGPEFSFLSYAFKNSMAYVLAEEKKTKIDDKPKNDKPKKSTKLLMEWPNALTTLAEEDEDDLAEEAHSLQQLLATVFNGLLI